VYFVVILKMRALKQTPIKIRQFAFLYDFEKQGQNKKT